MAGAQRPPVLYLANASTAAIRQAMSAGSIGQLATPAEGRTPGDSCYWAADNGCFGKGYPGDQGYLRWLEELSAWAGRALFATAPDVPGDAAGTLQRSLPFFEAIRGCGYPVALVAQNGLERLEVPWEQIDGLFLGGVQQCGSCGWVRPVGAQVPKLLNVECCPRCPGGTLSEWKTSRAAAILTLEAKRRGLWVHMGRVNSQERLREAAWMGVDSVDGTYLTFGPDKHLPAVRRWLKDLAWGPCRSPQAIQARTAGACLPAATVCPEGVA